MADILAAGQVTIAKVEDGENGDDGYSPTVTTGTSQDGSTTLIVTNKDGSTTTPLKDGKARTDAENAGRTATNYINVDDDGALRIKRNTDNYSVRIDADSLDIENDGEVLATFGETVTLGNTDSNNMQIDTSGILFDNNGTKIAKISPYNLLEEHGMALSANDSIFLNTNYGGVAAGYKDIDDNTAHVTRITSSQGQNSEVVARIKLTSYTKKTYVEIDSDYLLYNDETVLTKSKLVTERVTLASSESVPANGYVDLATKTVTKAGYYPIGIVGQQLSSAYCSFASIYLSKRDSGTATVKCVLNNVGAAAHSCNAYCYILWAKE